MELLQVDLVEEAQSKLKTFIEKLPPKTETISLRDAVYHCLAQDIYAPEDVPLFERSTVDGYAVIASDTYGACDSIPVFLKIVEEVGMGKESTVKLEHGQCAYVPTGGMIPKGANAMVMIEHCENFNKNTIAVYKPTAIGQDVVHIGDDMKSGSLILKAGERLKPQGIAALATLGITKVKVRKPYQVAIISTGDELLPIDCTPKNGQIRESNSYCIAAQAEKLGMQVVSIKCYKDQELELEKGICDELENCDFIFLSGGSSQGKKDMTAHLFNKISDGGVCTHGLALKPGKPTILGWDEKTRTILVGLPGHPAAASIVFELLIARTIRAMRGQLYNPYIEAKIKFNIASAPGKETCMPVILNQKETYIEAEPIFGRSGNWSILLKADGYLLMERNQEGLKAGEIIKVYQM